MKKTTVSFTASATSAAISAGIIFAIQIPASFGATTIALTYCDTAGGTYVPVVNDTGTAIGITTSATVAQLIDMTSIFPQSISKINGLTGGYIKFTASGSITKDIIVYQEV